MTDIVERLRELYRFAAQQKSRDWDEQDEIRDLFKYTFDTTYEAADEIERLREALREAREEIICMSRKWVECEASEEELVGFIDAVLPRSALEDEKQEWDGEKEWGTCDD